MYNPKPKKTMALQKDHELGFAIFNYWRIDKGTPMIPYPLQNIASVNLNLYSSREYSIIPSEGFIPIQRDVASIIINIPLDEFSALWHNNPTNYLGCLYCGIKKLDEWKDTTDIFEEGQSSLCN